LGVRDAYKSADILWWVVTIYKLVAWALIAGVIWEEMTLLGWWGD